MLTRSSDPSRQSLRPAPTVAYAAAGIYWVLLG